MWKVFYYLEYIFIAKNLTNFCKMVETNVELCLNPQETH